MRHNRPAFGAAVKSNQHQRASRRPWLALPVLLLGAGCVQPGVTPPQSSLPIPAQWAEARPAAVSTQITDYWQLLGDPMLTELVGEAISANRDLAASSARLDAARASLVQARAARVPSLSASGRANRDLGDNAREGFQFSAGLDSSWEVDLFGQVSGSVDAAQADLAASGYSLADLQRLIVGQVATQYINARALSAQLAIARDTLANQDENLQIARWRNQAGLVSSLDVEQARTQRAQTAATIPALESSLAASANAISTLIGEPPGRVLAAIRADRTSAIPRPPASIGFAAPAEVLQRRPDVRSAEASLLASTARIGVARAQMMPLMRLTGTLGTQQATLGNLFDIVAGSLVASVSQLIFDGGRTQAAVDSAEANARAALAQWEGTILAALAEVENAAADQRSAAERVTINAEALDAATNSAILARSQYQAGLTDFRTLLTAESQLLSARNQVVSAEADRASAFVRLTQSLGGGWSPAEYDFPLPLRNRTPE